MVKHSQTIRRQFCRRIVWVCLIILWNWCLKGQISKNKRYTDQVMLTFLWLSLKPLKIWNIRSSLSEVFLGKCSEIMQQIYWRTPMPKCDFNKVKFSIKFIEITLVFSHGCSPVNLLHIFRTPFPKNTSDGLLLKYLVNHIEAVDWAIRRLTFA